MTYDPNGSDMLMIRGVSGNFPVTHRVEGKVVSTQARDLSGMVEIWAGEWRWVHWRCYGEDILWAITLMSQTLYTTAHCPFLTDQMGHTSITPANALRGKVIVLNGLRHEVHSSNPTTRIEEVWGCDLSSGEWMNGFESST